MGGDKSRSGTGRIDKPCGAHIQARALGRTQRTVDDVARAVRRLRVNFGRTVLAQILDGLDPKEFRRCAERHPMARETPSLSAYDHFAVMVFAQLTYRESLRDIEACLGSRLRLLYHSGIRGTVKRCNLADANEKRSAALFAEIAMLLMRRAKRLYSETPIELGLDGELFAIDASRPHCLT